MKVAENAKRLRYENSLTVEEASRRAGITRRTWEAVERHEVTPRVSTVAAMAKGLGVHPRELTRDPDRGEFVDVRIPKSQAAVLGLMTTDDMR